ncbi:MAG: hypothetical protein ACO1NO_00005, partial [Burkholderiaceae bacterium]
MVSNLFDGGVSSEPVITVTTPVTVNGTVRYGLAYVMRPALFNRIMAGQHAAGMVLISGGVTDMGLNVAT